MLLSIFKMLIFGPHAHNTLKMFSFLRDVKHTNFYTFFFFFKIFSCKPNPTFFGLINL